MKEYFSFDGTAKRQEYWGVYIVSVIAGVIGLIMLEGNGGLGALVALVLCIGALWAMLAVTVKRLRDAGLNGWWLVAIFIPYIGTVATIAFGCIGTKQGETQ